MVAKSPPQLLDQHGNPIVREALAQSNLASAMVSSVRQAVGTGVTRGLTPQRLAGILREAEEGDPSAYCELAEEMEEKDLHYLSVLGTRKRQVSQLDQTIEAPSGKLPEDADITADVQRTFLDSGLIDDCLFDVLDAVGKGFSLCEIDWETAADKWTPRSIDFVDPRFIRFDRATRRVPLLLTDNAANFTDGQNAMPLPPWKFIFCQIKAKSGLPLRGGIARAAAWGWMFKNFTVKDWMQFLDIYGIPFRLGKFAPGASDDDKDALLRTVASIAADACGIVPNTMDITFVETKAGSASGGGGVFSEAAQYFDDQLSKAVLGQTGTTDATPGKLGGTPDHTQVREDIERADAKALMACLNRQLIRPYIDLNYGPLGSDGQPRNYPWLRIGRPEKNDAALMVDTAVKLIPYGLEVRQDDILANAGFTKPQEGDKLLRAPPSGAPIGTGNAIPTLDLRPALASRAGDITQARALATSLAIELLSSAEADDPISIAVREQTAGWKSLVGKPVNQILDAAANSKTPDEFRAALAKLHGNLDMNALGERLALMTFQAFAGGATGDVVKPVSRVHG